MAKSIDADVIDKNIKDSFRRIIRSRSENGRGKSSEKILAEGVAFVRDKFLGDKKVEEFDARTLAKYLHLVDAVQSEEEGLRMVKSIPDMYEISDGGGCLYFERDGKNIVMGYSPYN
ncbi:hypothetical protein HY449_01515 [Candidatus Pacearchaeota archaeon]|nr:hypothetical protein [Candidatus Pacearchaeota archaeon]